MLRILLLLDSFVSESLLLKNRTADVVVVVVVVSIDEDEDMDDEHRNHWFKVRLSWTFRWYPSERLVVVDMEEERNHAVAVVVIATVGTTILHVWRCGMLDVVSLYRESTSTKESSTTSSGSNPRSERSMQIYYCSRYVGGWICIFLSSWLYR